MVHSIAVLSHPQTTEDGSSVTKKFPTSELDHDFAWTDFPQVIVFFSYIAIISFPYTKT